VEAFDQEKIDFAYPTQVIYSGKLGNSWHSLAW
jgi:hypothetical protein